MEATDKSENEFLEDYDLWFRLYHKKRTFYNISEILCYHRIHKGSYFNNSNYNSVDLLKEKWTKINKDYVI